METQGSSAGHWVNLEFIFKPGTKFKLFLILHSLKALGMIFLLDLGQMLDSQSVNFYGYKLLAFQLEI